MQFLLTKNLLNASPNQNAQDWENDYFTEIISLVNSSYTQHLRLHKNGKFQLYRILLHPQKNWEESRYEGKWNRIDSTSIALKPKSCRVYTSRHLLERRALTRAFDCDHVTMTFSKLLKSNTYFPQIEKFALKPDQYGDDHGETMQRFRSPGINHLAVVLSVNNELLGWGIDLSYYKPNQTGKIFSKDGIFLQNIFIDEVVETSFRFKSTISNSIKVGDIILLPKR